MHKIPVQTLPGMAYGRTGTILPDMRAGKPGNLLGRRHPPLSPDFKPVADELLHYTSRYYPYAESHLRKLGMTDIHLDGYKAQYLNNCQRRQMGSLLSRPATSSTLAKLGRLIEEIRQHRVFQLSVIDQTRTAAATSAKRQASTPELPDGLSPIEPLLHLARRFHFAVKVSGHIIRLSMKSLLRCLDAPDNTVRHNIRLALYWSHAAGYHLHNTDRD